MCSRSAFLRCLGLSGFGFLVVARHTHGIPQNFNQGTFFLRTGIAFEDFATNDATFAEGASLKGEWSKPDARGAQILADDAIVFGLPAKHVTAERDAGRVKQLVVTFEEDAKRARSPILDRVMQNITAFTGEPPHKLPDGSRVFRQGHVQIDVRSNDPRRVIATFTAIP
jgi:hypothetical protein